MNIDIITNTFLFVSRPRFTELIMHIANHRLFYPDRFWEWYSIAVVWAFHPGTSLRGRNGGRRRLHCYTGTCRRTCLR